MQNELLDAALNRAIAALETVSDREIHQLPLLDCTLLLDALPGEAALASMHRQVAERLHEELRIAWIEDGDMCQVFMVLAALWKYDPKYVGGEQLAAAVQRLVRSEVAVGGPYYSNHSDETLAIAAHVQIALFLRVAAQSLPHVDTFLAGVVTGGRFADTDLTRYVLLYLLAKAFDHPSLVQYVAEHWQEAAWQTPQREAMSLAILKNALSPIEARRTFVAICQKQRQSGFWDGESLYQKVTAQPSSRFATTSLITGALANFCRHPAKKPSLSRLQQRHRVVTKAAHQLFDVRTEPLRTSALATVDQICDADQNFEITLLPYYFAQAVEQSTPLTNKQFVALGLANVCVWIAYTIYDDFLDDEGDPSQLPIANVALRASLDCFKEASKQSDFQRYVAKVFTAMDEANAWEVNCCRFAVHAEEVVIGGLPRYGSCKVLAARSFAHVLAPMMVAQSQFHVSEARQIEAAFRHYLIARQLNDDLRDWQADLRAGQASYVVTAILRDMHTTPGAYSLRTQLPAMQKRFRQQTMPKVAQRILHHIVLSRQAFARSHLLRAKNDIYALLDIIELSVEHSLDEHAKSQALSTMPQKRSAGLSQK